MTDHRRLIYGITGIVMVVLAAMVAAVGWLIVGQRQADARAERTTQRLVEELQSLQECTVAVLLVEPDDRTAEGVRAVCPPLPDLPDDQPELPPPPASDETSPSAAAAPAPAAPAPHPPEPPPAVAPPPPVVAPPGPSPIPQPPPRPPPTTAPSEPRPPPLQPICDLLLRLC